MNFFNYLKTFVKHKYYVLCYAIPLGIPYQGLIHDLSKLSLCEFGDSIKYYQKGMSPQIKEREGNDGFSFMSIHHVGRNKHHWQYWVDYNAENILIYRMPYNYAIEFVCDSLAATRVYMGKQLTLNAPYDFFKSRMDNYLIHDASAEFLLYAFNLYQTKGFKALSTTLLKAKFDELDCKYSRVKKISIKSLGDANINIS